MAVLDPDVVQLSGDEPPATVAGLGRPTWKAHPPAAGAPRTATPPRCRRRAGATDGSSSAPGRISPPAAASGSSSTPPAARIRAARASASTAALAAAVARQIPVILAGGLDPASVGAAVLAVPAVGVDVASGVEAPRIAGQRPRKDPVRVALFVKRARAARLDRPNTPFRPTPVHPGLLDADAAGRWGMEREFGGRYVPETLMAALEQLERAYADLRDDPRFWAELRERLATYAGRPTPIYRADRMAEAVLADARRAPRRGPRRPPARRRPSGSTSSARTWPTPARTR